MIIQTRQRIPGPATPTQNEWRAWSEGGNRKRDFGTKEEAEKYAKNRYAKDGHRWSVWRWDSGWWLRVADVARDSLGRTWLDVTVEGCRFL